MRDEEASALAIRWAVSKFAVLENALIAFASGLDTANAALGDTPFTA